MLGGTEGISYGWLSPHAESALGLLAGSDLVGLGRDPGADRLARPRRAADLPPPRLGLIIGGALGNAIDRIVYGAVADFFSLHAFGYQWYVFNVADIAIVAGVVGLLYDSVFRGHKKVGNPSKM